jgi:hypothetical protein
MTKQCRLNAAFMRYLNGHEGPIHGQAFHSSSFHVLLRGRNLRLLVNLRVLPASGKTTKIKQRAGRLQTHQE